MPWYEVFGMTETGANIGVSPADHDRAVGTGCLGPRARGTTRRRSSTRTAVQVAPGEVGELVLRGLGFMDGYHRDPDATARVLPRRVGAHRRPVLAWTRTA